MLSDFAQIDGVSHISDGQWFFDNCFRWIFSIEPSVSTIETFSKSILFALLQLYSCFGNTNFCLYIILLDDSCNGILANVLIFQCSVNCIKSIWYDWAESLLSWHSCYCKNLIYEFLDRIIVYLIFW